MNHGLFSFDVLLKVPRVFPCPKLTKIENPFAIIKHTKKIVFTTLEVTDLDKNLIFKNFPK